MTQSDLQKCWSTMEAIMTLILHYSYVGILVYMYSLLTYCRHQEIPFGSVLLKMERLKDKGTLAVDLGIIVASNRTKMCPDRKGNFSHGLRSGKI